MSLTTFSTAASVVSTGACHTARTSDALDSTDTAFTCSKSVWKRARPSYSTKAFSSIIVRSDESRSAAASASKSLPAAFAAATCATALSYDSSAFCRISSAP